MKQTNNFHPIVKTQQQNAIDRSSNRGAIVLCYAHNFQIETTANNNKNKNYLQLLQIDITYKHGQH